MDANRRNESLARKNRRSRAIVLKSYETYTSNRAKGGFTELPEIEVARYPRRDAGKKAGARFPSRLVDESKEFHETRR